MKNIQVIDGANNCTYSIYAAKDEDFNGLFPAENQDIEFADDFIKRVGKKKAKEFLERLWINEQDKKNVTGIHGTLFYEMSYKKKYYPDKNEKKMIIPQFKNN